ncbi:hypothetical protein COU61_03945 [Candidatus Pacearchaeota archaeon CG10_big_fil_rev_8_21_14_0_10_35_13]|nr:MAG: hypothetical protein COU61_03945 [Candidatus Pacearchaeota archaeon CG10_big_fil_rev_8_21_14_0_10_35_13]
MKQNYVLGVLAISVIALLGIGLVSASNGFGIMSKFSGNSQNEAGDSFRTAVENNDYDSWKSLMDERVSLMQAEINVDNFNAMVDQHESRTEFRNAMNELKASGDFSRDKILELREQYGIEGPEFNSGRNEGRGFGMMRQGNCLLD